MTCSRHSLTTTRQFNEVILHAYAGLPMTKIKTAPLSDAVFTYSCDQSSTFKPSTLSNSLVLLVTIVNPSDFA